MSSGTKLRTPARRYNVAEVAEIRRLAKWWDGIADDYDAALYEREQSGQDTAGLRRQERDARQMAAQLRAKVADR